MSDSTTLIKIKRGDNEYIDAELLKIGEPALTLSTSLTGDNHPQEGYTVSDYNLRIGDGQTVGGVQFLNSMDSQTVSSNSISASSTSMRYLERSNFELTFGENTIYNRYLMVAGDVSGGVTPVFEIDDPGANRDVVFKTHYDMFMIHAFGKSSCVYPELYGTSVCNEISIPTYSGTGSSTYGEIYVLGFKGIPYWDLYESNFHEEISDFDFKNYYIYVPDIKGPYRYLPDSHQYISGYGIDISYVLDEDDLDSDMSISLKDVWIANAVVHVPSNDLSESSFTGSIMPAVFKQYHGGKYGVNIMEADDNTTEYGFPFYDANTERNYLYTNDDLDVATNYFYGAKKHFISFDKNLGTNDYKVDIDIVSYDGSSYQQPELNVIKRLSTGFIVENPSLSDRIKFVWSIKRNRTVY